MIGKLLKKLLKRFEPKQTARNFLLKCEFGSEVTSPIPSVKPSHNVDSSTIPAVPGRGRVIFPNKRPETALFRTYIVDEHGVPCGIRCIILDYPPMFEEMGFPKSPAQRLELMVGEEQFFDDSTYENGKRFYTFRSFTLLEDTEPES